MKKLGMRPRNLILGIYVPIFGAVYICGYYRKLSDNLLLKAPHEYIMYSRCNK
jgi:hypothetical protein